MKYTVIIYSLLYKRIVFFQPFAADLSILDCVVIVNSQYASPFAMHFVSSTYVEDCITDEFVLRVLKEWNVSEENNNCKRPNWLSLQDYKHIFQCSPTALRRAIFPGTEFTRRILNDNGEIIMGRDEPLLRFAVLTGLINDYIRYHEFASQICKIKCFEVVVNGFQHFLRFKGKEDLYFIEKAQYGPFDKEYQYGYHIKFKKVSNDWGI